MIDIHSHILPCLDDGAGSMEESVAMFRIAAKEGITSIITTPHCYGHRRSALPEKIQERFARAQKELLQEKIPIHLYAGNEIQKSSGDVLAQSCRRLSLSVFRCG